MFNLRLFLQSVSTTGKTAVKKWRDMGWNAFKSPTHWVHSARRFETLAEGSVWFNFKGTTLPHSHMANLNICKFLNLATQPYSHISYMATKDPTKGGGQQAVLPLWRRPARMFDVCCGTYCSSNGVVVVTKTDILCRKITKISRT